MFLVILKISRISVTIIDEEIMEMRHFSPSLIFLCIYINYLLLICIKDRLKPVPSHILESSVAMLAATPSARQSSKPSTDLS